MDFRIFRLQVFILLIFVDYTNCVSVVFTSYSVSHTVSITTTDSLQTVTKTFTKYIKSEDVISNTYATSMTESTNRERCLMNCNKDPGCVTASYSSLGTCLCSPALPANLSLPDPSDLLTQLTYTYVKEFLYLGTDAMSWENSKLFCMNLGYKLMEIYSSEENEYVTKYLIERSMYRVWIGANDKQEENKYVWNDDTTQISYTQFAPDEPNNWTLENCAFLDPSENGNWYDYQCHLELIPLCRII